MRLFISYARVDKPYCLQIVNLLEAHEVWYDQRLYAGQQWWKEILRRLDWCEGFVYLLSPDSVQSEYCQKEFEIALQLGRHIFPVLIHPQTELPVQLNDMQYVDMTKGRTSESVKELLNAIYYAERYIDERQEKVASIAPKDVQPPVTNPATLIGEIARAMENSHADRAVYLIQQAISQNIQSRFINLPRLLEEAKADLERQTYLRKAEHDYRQIIELVKRPRTRQFGCEAFTAFRDEFPDYDPDNIRQYCPDLPPVTRSIIEREAPQEVAPPPPLPERFTLPLLEWVHIPGGAIKMKRSGVAHDDKNGTRMVDEFFISKYPVTNAQYTAFIEDMEGYANPKWWQFTDEARRWHDEHKSPRPSQFKGDERPRDNVNWYEAVAFCNWLSHRLFLPVTLPTEWEWIRAARGDDERLFPWGDKMDVERCNTSESKIKMTTSVTRFVKGVSPFGVYDMVGNVWEWCLNTESHDTQLDCDSETRRAVQGGSYLGKAERAQISFGYYINPRTAFGNIGFRVMYSLKRSKRNGRHD